MGASRKCAADGDQGSWARHAGVANDDSWASHTRCRPLLLRSQSVRSSGPSACMQRSFVEMITNGGVAGNKPVGDKTIEHEHLFLAQSRPQF
jgi:hypothetical protein